MPRRWSATAPSAPRCTRTSRPSSARRSPFVMLYQQTEVAAYRAQRRWPDDRADLGFNLYVRGRQAIGESGQGPRRDRPLLGDRRADLPRPARGHILHRPGDPGRSGAGHRRRPRTRACDRSGCARRWASTSRCWEQFVHLRRAKPLHGDFGTSVLTSNPVWNDIKKTFPATLELATCGILIGAGLGVPLGVWAAVRRGGIVDHSGARDRPGRLFGADLLARPDGAGAVLREARLGRRAGPHRCGVRVFGAAGHRPAAARCGDGRRVGGLWQRVLAPGAAGLAAGLLLAGLHQPHDALASC